jgi:hypothetical protein
MADMKRANKFKQNVPNSGAFPDSRSNNADTLTRRNAGVAGGSVMPLELRTIMHDKGHKTITNNEAERAAQGRATAPPDRAPSFSPTDLAENLNRQGMGWAKGVK